MFIILVVRKLLPIHYIGNSVLPTLTYPQYVFANRRSLETQTDSQSWTTSFLRRSELSASESTLSCGAHIQT